MSRILEFDAANTTPTAGSLTNVIGVPWTVVRNSIATYNNSGIVTQVAIDVPRIQDSKTLIELQKTNLITYSDAYTQGNWSTTRCTLDAGTNPSPDGGNTAVGIISSIDNDDHALNTFFTNTATTTYTYSLYLKQGDKPWAQLRNTSDDASAFFDLVNGVIGTTFNCTASIEVLADGWHRCSITSDSTVQSNFYTYRIYPAEADGDRTFAGDGVTVDTYAFGADGELDNPTSYIKTVASQVTREADVITNTVPSGTAPITMTTWIDGVSDSGQVVNQGDPITMLNGTTAVIIEDSTTTTVEIEWIDSISAGATGNKIYRDDVEIADIAMGVQIYQDATAETGTEYKYEVQAYDGVGGETTLETVGVNTQFITTA